MGKRLTTKYNIYYFLFILLTALILLSSNNLLIAICMWLFSVLNLFIFVLHVPTLFKRKLIFDQKYIASTGGFLIMLHYYREQLIRFNWSIVESFVIILFLFSLFFFVFCIRAKEVET